MYNESFDYLVEKFTPIIMDELGIINRDTIFITSSNEIIGKWAGRCYLGTNEFTGTIDGDRVTDIESQHITIYTRAILQLHLYNTVNAQRHIIETLAHELRHSYQLEKYNTRHNVNTEYKEKDAIKYATSFMIKHEQEISITIALYNSYNRPRIKRAVKRLSAI